MTIFIREFTERDIEELTSLMKKLCRINGQEFEEERWRTSLETQMSQDTNSEVIVAFDKNDNQVMGMANCAVKTSDKGFRFGYVSNLIVKEEKRRSGIGEKIIHHIIDFFKRNHIDSIRVALKPNLNKAAQKLFMKVGFEEIYHIFELKI
ncbi:MAG: GNAT family N-acetyltransferase [Candidatus Lokiarchaeota archaeon]|nr:GNAT family N-acetyltransferase [Candidatus Lokiarchaeota archaeon]MBD3200112.1 GNAT family N-acetyltransferase [Candidatus Lokiarchaeota archaeon]